MDGAGEERELTATTTTGALLADRRFAALWLNQALGQTAQYALLFTLLLLVLDLTGSSIHMTVLVLSFLLPSVFLGMPVAVLLDRWRKESVLLVSNLVRAMTCLFFLFFHSDVWIIYGANLVFAAASQFFNPAVVALIPALVPKRRLINANTLYNFTLMSAQFAGIVFLTPTMLRSVGEQGMFIVGAAFFALAAGLTFFLQPGDQARREARWEGPLFGGIPEDFRASWRALRGDLASVMAMVQLTLSSALVLLFAILVPRYMKDILGVSAHNAAFVFAPTGVGAILGLRLLPWFTQHIKKELVVTNGLGGIGLCLLALALVEPLAELLELLGVDPEGLGGRGLLWTLTMFFAFPLGLSYALINAPAQTVLHERAPAEMRGRIFTTQVVSANFFSLLPLLLIGAITDVLGISLVLMLVALGLAVAGALNVLVARRSERSAASDASAQRMSAQTHDRVLPSINVDTKERAKLE
ncbi:MAG: MFS transporter [Dehalococcoidia bacterium]